VALRFECSANQWDLCYLLLWSFSSSASFLASSVSLGVGLSYSGREGWREGGRHNTCLVAHILNVFLSLPGGVTREEGERGRGRGTHVPVWSHTFSMSSCHSHGERLGRREGGSERGRERGRESEGGHTYLSGRTHLQCLLVTLRGRHYLVDKPVAQTRCRY